uniref:Uncharacterized protein n=1 Tax=Knipowitschia caucasica TaxID=637954 RepID=A0AAV2KVQ9_KNICA
MASPVTEHRGEEAQQTEVLVSGFLIRSTLVSDALVHSTPVSNTLICSTLVSDALVHSTPGSGVSVSGVPVSGVPVSGVPVSGVPVSGGVPVSDVLVHSWRLDLGRCPALAVVLDPGAVQWITAAVGLELVMMDNFYSRSGALLNPVDQIVQLSKNENGSFVSGKKLSDFVLM